MALNCHQVIGQFCDAAGATRGSGQTAGSFCRLAVPGTQGRKEMLKRWHPQASGSTVSRNHSTTEGAPCFVRRMDLSCRVELIEKRSG